MTGEQAEKIKNIIEESDSFALILNENAKEHELLARKTLKAALQSKGKSVCMFPETPDEFKERWSAILPAIENAPLTHTSSIRIPKNQLNIKEISYENEDDFFTVNIKSENNGLSKEGVIIESRPAEIGAIFVIGPQNAGYLNEIGNQISLPSEDKIVSVNENSMAVAEKIRDIIRNIDEALLSKHNIPTLLFAALLIERTSRYEQSRGKTMEIERELLSLGADKKFVNEMMMDFLSLDHLPVI